MQELTATTKNAQVWFWEILDDILSKRLQKSQLEQSNCIITLWAQVKQRISKANKYFLNHVIAKQIN